MTPTAWYESRIARKTSERGALERTATLLSRARLITFFAGAVLVGWGLPSTAQRLGWIAVGVAAFVAFAILVIRHARVLNQIEAADAALRYHTHGLGRIDREWAVLPDIEPPASLDPDAHPYARDLDIFGHASLAKWLGRPATIEGGRVLWRWLLAPADAATIVERQRAVDDLAARPEWRESLAAEGSLTIAREADFFRFLDWAERRDLALPRVMQIVAMVLPIFTIGGILALVLGVTDAAWFLLPLTIAIALSFVLAARIYAVFDRATVGQRALERYASMLALACGEAWTAPALIELKGRLCAGGDAPERVRALARIGGWSELRTGAALLHFPIQALTLWDIHVYFALERWRRQSGAHVRGWVDALAEIDALAVLARARFDEPSWVHPDVSAEATAVRASALGHPLIAAGRRVANDVTVGPRGTLLLITGSNMSGKSTLLRAIGLNTVLAQAGAPVCASAFAMPPLDVQTSIRVQDSLELGLSYFMAALARLKQIVDQAERGSQPGRTMFYLLDEVLQGTNSVERGLAVRAVVRHLLDAGAVGVMTTHDLALADEEPIKSAAVLAHFTEHVHPDGTMTFDYRLRPGLATSTNALRLMQLIGITPK